MSQGPKQLAPLHPWEFPQEPWHRVLIDLAGPYEDRLFLVALDAHSKWPEVTIMKSTTTEKTIEALGEMFSRFGSPTQLSLNHANARICYYTADHHLTCCEEHLSSQTSLKYK